MSLGRSSSGKRRLQGFLLQKDNQTCADCGAPDPKWASSNIGVFICLKCSGVHRSLGTHISKVLSVTLDEWSDDEIDSIIEVGGNSAANLVYEAYIPHGLSKPRQNASHEERAKFIRSKYELQEFMKPSLRVLSSSSKGSASHQTSSHSTSFAQSSEGMVEYIGMLKIKLIKGTKLAIKDMRTSDPYVVLTLGHQKAQTSVMQSNLNPVWNEELMLSVPQSHGSVKLQVFDHDTLSADDIMGEAEINIQPMLTSVKSLGDARMFGDMQIGKWMKSDDNALVENSIINIVDGKVVQALRLKLQNVETGEIELQLEWIPLDQ